MGTFLQPTTLQLDVQSKDDLRSGYFGALWVRNLCRHSADCPWDVSKRQYVAVVHITRAFDRRQWIKFSNPCNRGQYELRSWVQESLKSEGENKMYLLLADAYFLLTKLK